MSTTFEIGRCPAAFSRCLSHSGEGPIFTSSNTRAVKRRQISGSAISTLAWSSAESEPLGLENLPHHERRRVPHARAVEALELVARHREHARDLLGRQAGVAVRAQ